MIIIFGVLGVLLVLAGLYIKSLLAKKAILQKEVMTLQRGYNNALREAKNKASRATDDISVVRKRMREFTRPD